jgi:hypothetical protein
MLLLPDRTRKEIRKIGVRKGLPSATAAKEIVFERHREVEPVAPAAKKTTAVSANTSIRGASMTLLNRNQEMPFDIIRGMEAWAQWAETQLDLKKDSREANQIIRR